MAQQIARRQIQDAAIDNSKIGSDAAIASTKLADGANFLKKDGSVAMTGNFDAGNQRVINVGTPSGGTDAANKTYVDGLIAGINQIFDAKESVRAATTANITISNPGTDTFDGIALNSGERLLVKSQSAPAENGIYVFNGSSSALTRATDLNTWAKVPGAFLAVEEGTTLADTIWLSTANAAGTLATTAITWQQIPTSAGLLNANFVDGEVPSGSLNGSNVTFTLANTPTAGSVKLFLNGLKQRSGGGNDYTISGGTITMAVAPLSTDYLEADYRK